MTTYVPQLINIYIVSQNVVIFLIFRKGSKYNDLIIFT